MEPDDSFDLSPLESDDVLPHRDAVDKAQPAPRRFLLGEDFAPARPSSVPDPAPVVARSAGATPMGAGQPAPVARAIPPPAPGPRHPVPAPAPAPAHAPAHAAAPWWPLGWRCGVVYLLLYTLPFPLTLDPTLQSVVQAWESGKQAAVSWLVERFFPIELTAFPAGSGDTTYNYFEILSHAVAGLLIGCTWHWLRIPRIPGPRARDAARTWLRYYLASVLLGYGVAKVIPNQFGTLDVGQLSATYGQSSPMNLLWTFMAASPAYTVFVGAAEVLAAALLLWRRTATLGAVVGFGVMANVVMLNMCYDVPVKLFSSHLLLMCALVGARDFRRLIGLFFANRAVPAADLWPWHPSRWLRWPLLVIKCALVGVVLWGHVDGNLERFRSRAEVPPLSGVWSVETFLRSGREVPPFTAPDRWQRIEIGPFGATRVVLVDGSSTWYRHEIDLETNTLVLKGVAGPERQAPPPVELDFRAADADHLVIHGQLDGAELRLGCRRLPPDGFLLVNRGFHWINEFPLNRR